MFGNNRILKKVKDHDGQSLQVVLGSPFRTIQGEGPYSGCPAVFVRLHGCNLACTFCDTDFDSDENPVVPIQALCNSVIGLFGPEAYRLCVITGGEPLRQNIVPFMQKLHSMVDVTIQIETAGTLWVEDVHRYAGIVCSPKTPVIHPHIYDHAIAFKYLIDSENKHDGFIPITSTQDGVHQAMQLAKGRDGVPVYLSPLDTYDENRNRLNRQLVADLAMRYGVHASVQLHKALEVD